jgi:hypothetical protein
MRSAAPVIQGGGQAYQMGLPLTNELYPIAHFLLCLTHY